MGEQDKAVTDYTRLNELPGAPPESVVSALYARAIRHAEEGRTDEEVADYTTFIERLPGTPTDLVARCLGQSSND